MRLEFKLRSERAFTAVEVPDGHLSAAQLKQAINAKRPLTDGSTALVLEDAETGQEIRGMDADSLRKMIVRRVPLGELATGAAGASREAKADESDRIDRVVQQHQAELVTRAPVLKFSSSVPGGKGGKGGGMTSWQAWQQDSTFTYGENLTWKREGYEDGEGPAVPKEYRCHRCGEGGHFIQDCPTLDDPEFTRKIRHAKGIPKVFLRTLTEDEFKKDKCAFTTIGGNYVTMRDATDEQVEDVVGVDAETQVEKVVGVKLEGALQCPLCSRLYEDAINTPCCGKTYCESCIVQHLTTQLDGDVNKCPSCSAELFPHKLIVNKIVRAQVDAVRKGPEDDGPVKVEKRDPRDAMRMPRPDRALPEVAEPPPVQKPIATGFFVRSADLLSEADFEAWKDVCRLWMDKQKQEAAQQIAAMQAFQAAQEEEARKKEKKQAKKEKKRKNAQAEDGKRPKGEATASPEPVPTTA